MKMKLILKQIASWSVETEIIIEVELTKKEREDDNRPRPEITRADEKNGCHSIARSLGWERKE